MNFISNDDLMLLSRREQQRYLSSLYPQWEANIEIPVVGRDLLELPPASCPDRKPPENGQPTTGECQGCEYFMGAKGLEAREYQYGETVHACCGLRLNAKLSGNPLPEFKLPEYFRERFECRQPSEHSSCPEPSTDVRTTNFVP